MYFTTNWRKSQSRNSAVEKMRSIIQYESKYSMETHEGENGSPPTNSIILSNKQKGEELTNNSTNRIFRENEWTRKERKRKEVFSMDDVNDYTY